MSTSIWLDRSRQQKTKTYDFVILGAGIAGVSAGYWLSKKYPKAKIAILEKNRLGFGASGRNAGFVTAGSVDHYLKLHSKWGAEKATEIWRYSETNIALVKEHVIATNNNLEFAVPGSFTVAPNQEELKKLQKAAEFMRQQGIEIEELNESAVQKRLGLNNFIGAIKYLKDGVVHPNKLLQHLQSLSNAEIFENTEVYGIESVGKNLKTKTDLHTFEAPHAISTLNGFTHRLFPEFKKWIEPTRGQILVLEPTTQYLEAPCYSNVHLNYFRQLPTGETLIGGFRHLETATEVGDSDHTTPKIQSALEEFLRTHIPNCKNLKVAYRWAGVMGFSQDGLPLLGQHPKIPNLWILGGYTGHGMGLAFHTAKTLVDSLEKDVTPGWLKLDRQSL